MPITRNGMVLASLKRGTSQIAFVFQGTMQVWAHEIVFMLGASSAAAYLVDIVSARPGLWATSTPKRVVVPAGVERGSGTSWVLAIMPAGSSAASSWAGKLTLEVRGTLSGIGGAPNSGKGGDVIWVNFPGRNGEKLQINVLPGATLRPGGGGGGASGAGGQGFYQTPYTYQEGPTVSGVGSGSGYYVYNQGSYEDHYYWGGHVGSGYSPNGYLSTGGWVYYRSSLYTNGTGGDSDEGTYQWANYYILRQQTRYNNYYPLGGAARPGGRGQGFDGPAAAGGAAVGGAGSGAGASGTGGTGGAYGVSGGAGTAGVNGNYGAATGGAAGGLAGFYLNGAANSNFVNTGGTVLGRVA